MNNKISVIVPMYNVIDYIERCINSILKQDYYNYEIIIVNDGSTDGSRNKIKQYENLENVIIIDKQNGGLSSARNVGLDNATGEYILFVDSDDYILPNTLKEAHDKINECNSDMCCFRIAYFSNNETFIGGSDFGNDIIEGTENIIKDALINKNIKSSACVKLYRANLIQNNHIRFIPGIINEDYPFLIDCVQYMSRICFINKSLYFAYQRDNSISRDFKERNITSFIELYSYIWDNSNLKPYDVKDYYDAGFVKNELYTMVQAAYRCYNYKDFYKLYNILKNYSRFFELLHNDIINKLDIKCKILSKIISNPIIFYSSIRLLRFFKLKIA